jgi:hypothetical protein
MRGICEGGIGMAKFLVRDLSGKYSDEEIDCLLFSEAAETYVETRVAWDVLKLEQLPLKLSVTLEDDTRIFKVTGECTFSAYAEEES